MRVEKGIKCHISDSSSFQGENYYLQLSTIDGGCCVTKKDFSSDETELYRIRTEVIDLLKEHFFTSPYQANLSKVPFHLHPMLQIMWGKAEEWHLLPSDHCDVYGFNIWTPMWLEEKTNMCFGGPTERNIWKLSANARLSDNNVTSSRSCASNGWICCMAFSEFDYLLVCNDQKSQQYGHVHHVNIHHDEENFCCTVDELFLYLLDFINEGKEIKKSARHDNRPRLNRGLRRIRDAVIDSLSSRSCTLIQVSMHLRHHNHHRASGIRHMGLGETFVTSMNSELSSCSDGDLIDNRYHTYVLKLLDCGVTLRFQPSVLSECPQIILTLEDDLQECFRVLPPSVFSLVQRTAIWINLEYSIGSYREPQVLKNPTTHHHEGWLISNLDNPKKTRGIEIYNASEYLKLRMYWNGCGLLLHEICHIIHQSVLPDGLYNDQVIKSFNHVVACGKYDNVLRRDWIMTHHACPFDVAYATVNCKECFAEMSVTFLSTDHSHLDSLLGDHFLSNPPTLTMDSVKKQGHCNKFFPFTNGQLRNYDHILFNYIKEIWAEILEWEDDYDLSADGNDDGIEDTVDL